MLRPRTQPGSTLDFRYPDETVTVVFKSNVRLEITADLQANRVSANEIQMTVTPANKHWIPLNISLYNASQSSPELNVSWLTAEDSRPRALPVRRLLLPWALPEQGSEVNNVTKIPEINGGRWLAGRKLFFGERLGCSKCHQVNGLGGKIGPDLSNLTHRDYASVLKDVIEPSAAINPDHVAYTVELKNAESITGVLVGTEGGVSRFVDVTGKTTAYKKAEISSITTSTISLMPEGLLNGLSQQQTKDLFTFLLTRPPLDPAPILAKGEAPVRKRTEVEFLLNNHHTISTTRPLQIVLCSGPKDHGPGEHDYPLWQERWTKLLSLAENVTTERASGWPTPQQFQRADTILFYSNNPGWTTNRGTELDQFLQRGGGLVYLHYAVDGHDNCDELANRIGLAWRGGVSKFRHGPLKLECMPHPITKGLSTVDFVDESYWNLIGHRENIQLLGTAVEENASQPLLWTREQGKGRVFVSIPGHYTWTFDDPLFRALILRGIAWSAHEETDRLTELAEIGARLSN
jgi:putative heme-binding domain-containing protein